MWSEKRGESPLDRSGDAIPWRLGRAPAVPEPSAQPCAREIRLRNRFPFVRLLDPLVLHSLFKAYAQVNMFKYMFDPAEPGSPASRQCVRHTGHTRGLS